MSHDKGVDISCFGVSLLYHLFLEHRLRKYSRDWQPKKVG